MKLIVFTLVILVVLAMGYTKPCSDPLCGDLSHVDEDKIVFNGEDSINHRIKRDYGDYRESDCPNCYAQDFGNGDYSNNTINIERK